MKWNLPASPSKEHWLFKNAYYLFKDRLGFLLTQRKEMGQTYSLTSPIRRVIITSNPDHIKRVLQDNNKNYRKSFAYTKIAILLGNGLLTSEGSLWLKQRRLIQPAFYKEKLTLIGQVMIEKTELFFRDWEGRVGQTIDYSAEMNKIALEIVTQTLFFSEIENKQSLAKISEWVTEVIEDGSKRIATFFPLPLWFPLAKNRKLKKNIRALDEIIFGIIHTRRAQKQASQDLLSLLMDAKDEETKDSMSDQQLRDEVMTLFMAGHETSANALTWIGYILTQNPEILEKLLKEIDTLLDGKPLTFSLLPEFTYTKQVIEEGLRMYPPAWIIGRESIKQDKLDDYDVPPNCTVALPIYIAHHDEAWWENPHVFLPERFSPENQKSLPRFAYFPFGGGPRLCVGSHFALMEMQIVLILMLRKFQLTNKNEIVPQPDPLITLRPHTPIFMEIQKR